MKKAILLILIASVTTLVGAQNAEVNPQGAWNLVQILNEVDGNTNIVFPSATSKMSQHKVWTKNKWMFASNYVGETGTFNDYGGGSYTLEGNQYAEYIDFSTYKEYLGKTVKMKMKFVNDTLVQSYHPVDTLGNVMENLMIIEKYVRWE
jgi:hypothetical protein